jgi:hypothetical protein
MGLILKASFRATSQKVTELGISKMETTSQAVTIKSSFHWKVASWVRSLFGASNDLLSKLNFIESIYLFLAD